MKTKQNLTTLIIVPAQFKGGVYNYYKNLSFNLPSNYSFYYLDNIKFNSKNKLFQTIYHFIKVAKIIKVSSVKKLILNPSLNINSIVRDSFYVILGMLFNLEITIFWRGFNFENVKYLNYPYKFITFLLFRPQTTVVLYTKIGKYLKQIGYKGDVKLMTTIVGDEVFNYKLKEKSTNEFNLVFLSRVEVYKGIYELLKAFELLSLKHSNLKLIIAGDGDDFEKVVKEIKIKNYKNVVVTGYLTGKDKYDVLSEGDLFVFPSYSEGMPNAVLESMAIGLPIITTKVGGLNDFFEDNVMGCFIETKDVNSIVDKVEYLLKHKNIRKKMSLYNINFAKTNFNSVKVKNNFLKI